MSHVEHSAAIARWAARNFEEQLRHIPEEKLAWKPEPTAKSAAEITGEVVGVFRMAMPLLSGGTWDPQEFPKPATTEEARRLVHEEAERYAAALESASPQVLEGTVDSPFGGKMRVGRAALFPLIDLIHHHGQLTYIQSLLGDAENHADMEAIRECFGAPDDGQ